MNQLAQINKKDITFVIQGALFVRGKWKTKACIASIKKYFPDSKIILSTWVGQNVDGINVDEILLNNDPGPIHNYNITGYRHNNPNQFNRQLVSTLSGLKKVKTKYAVKIRADFVLTSDIFLNLYNKFESDFPRPNTIESKIFQQRILMPNFFTQNSIKGDNLSYHISDIFHFGLTEDLLKLWNIPLMTLEEAKYCEDNNLYSKKMGAASQYIVEQYLFIKSLEANNIKFTKPKYYFDNDESCKQDSERLMMNNFIIGCYYKMGFTSKFNFVLEERSCYNEESFLDAYIKYADKNNSHMLGLYNKLKQHFKKEILFFKNSCLIKIFKLKINYLHLFHVREYFYHIAFSNLSAKRKISKFISWLIGIRNAKKYKILGIDIRIES